MKKVIIIDVKKKEKELEDKYNRHILQDRYMFDKFYQKKYSNLSNSSSESELKSESESVKCYKCFSAFSLSLYLYSLRKAWE